MPKILTISIPTWNRASLLKKLLTEVTDNLSKFNLENDIELLISNNNSDDTTEDIINSFLNKFNFITYKLILIQIPVVKTRFYFIACKHKIINEREPSEYSRVSCI